MRRERQERKVSIPSAAEDLGRRLDGFQTLQARGLGQLTMARRARVRAAERAIGRLGSQPGRATKTEIARLAMERERNAMLGTVLGRAQMRAALKVPAPAPDRFVLFGQVVDPDGDPREGVRLTVHDRAHKPLAGVPEIVSDSRGGFAFELSERTVPKSVGDDEKSEGKKESAGKPTARVSGLAAVYVGVRESAKDDVRIVPSPVAAKLGMRSFIEVVLKG